MPPEPALIDLDVPAERPPRPRRRTVPLAAALAMTVAGAAAGGGVATYVARRPAPLRVAAVSADISAEVRPTASFADGRARLDGFLTIVNRGASPIKIVDVRMEPARTHLNATTATVIKPGVSRVVSLTATVPCPDSHSMTSGAPTVIVSVSTARSPVPFDDGEWFMQALRVCQPG